MRILCLTIWYPNPENPTLGTFIHDQAEALRVAGLDVRIVQPVPFAPFPVTLFKRRYRNLAMIPKRMRNEGFEVYHPRYITFPRHSLFEHVGDLMYRGIEKTIARIYEEWPFDIIHAHTTYPCGYVANLIRDRFLRNVKVVHTVHRLCIVDVPRYNPRCRERVCVSLTGADRVIFVSNEGHRLGVHYAGKTVEEKSEYITNGVNPAKFDLSERDRVDVKILKTKYRDSWNLVFVANVSERKGVKELLLAVRRLIDAGRHDLRLFLVGRNESGAAVKNFLVANRMCSMVHEIGPVPHAHVKIWMNFADAVILPSHSEGTPTVLFESLYARAPAIFTGVGGITDIVEDGRECLIIPSKSVEAIEQAILQLMDNSDLGRKMGARGHDLICGNFTWAHNAMRHVHLYETVVTGSGVASGQ